MTVSVAQTEGWIQLLTALGVNLQGITLVIDQETEVLRFEGDQAALNSLQATLQRTFNTPEQLQAALPYQLNPVQDRRASETEQSTLTLAPAVEKPQRPAAGSGMVTMQALLGNILKLSRGFQLDWAAEFQDIEGVLWLEKPLTDEYDKNGYQRAFNKIKQAMSQQASRRIRAAYEGKGSIALDGFEPASPDSHRFDEKILEKCFGFVPGGDGETLAFIDYQLLYDLLYPPTFTLQSAVEGEQHCLQVPTKPLTRYLAAAFPEQLVLAMKNETSGHPVFLPDPHPTTPDNVIVALLDTSGSMDRTTDYQQKAQKLVDKLRTAVTGPNDRLLIVPFADEHQVHEFRAGQAFSMPTLTCSGGTNIYGSLTALGQTPLSPNTNFTIVMMTDGEHNAKGVDKSVNFGATQTTPQVFVLGLGDHHNPGQCQAIATATGGQYQRLASVAELANIDAHLTAIQQPRTLLRAIGGREIAGQLQEIYNQVVALQQAPVYRTDITIEAGDTVQTQTGQAPRRVMTRPLPHLVERTVSPVINTGPRVSLASLVQTIRSWATSPRPTSSVMERDSHNGDEASKKAATASRITPQIS